MVDMASAVSVQVERIEMGFESDRFWKQSMTILCTSTTVGEVFIVILVAHCREVWFVGYNDRLDVLDLGDKGIITEDITVI